MRALQTQISSSEIFIAPKQPRLSLAIQNHGLSIEEALTLFKEQGLDPQEILASTNEQLSIIKTLKELVPQENIITWDKISKESFKKAKVVIALGGDGHFLYTSRHLENQILVGVNSAPQYSCGDLLKYEVKRLPRIIEALQSGDYQTEKWPLLQASLDGVAVSTASSQYFISEQSRFEITQLQLEFMGQSNFQFCSGLVVAT
jgi:NAD kinase